MSKTSQLTHEAVTTHIDTLSTTIESAAQSVKFVKKLVSFGISTISYLRLIFPETSFGLGNCDGMAVKILYDEPEIPAAKHIIQCMKGSFDALEKQYLRTLTFAVCDKDDPNLALETYTFKFSYADDGIASMDNISSNDKTLPISVKKPTLHLLHTILMMTNGLQELPDSVSLSIKLTYYDNKTPDEYEPPGFKATEDVSYKFDGNIKRMQLGEINTHYHNIKMKFETPIKRFKTGESSDEENTNIVVESLPESEAGAKSQGMETVTSTPILTQFTSDREIDTPIPDIDLQLPFSPVSNKILHTPKTALTDMNRSFYSDAASQCSVRSTNACLSLAEPDLNYPVRCPCGVNKDDGVMIQCDVCSYWQHGACFCVLNVNEAPEQHICNICADPTYLCTDSRLCCSDMKQVKATCIYRRALVALQGIDDSITSNELAMRLGIDIRVISNLTKQLLSEFVIASKLHEESTYTVDKESLFKFAFPKYLSKTFDVETTVNNETIIDNSAIVVNPIIEKSATAKNSPICNLSSDISDSQGSLVRRSFISRRSRTSSSNKPY